MKLIAVISHKGGAGKTTSAVQIAEELARRGQRTLLVDADRQQGAGLLLGIDAPAGCVQRTTVPQLDYLGSARLTDLEIADCYAGVADRFDVGVVDTPSLDEPAPTVEGSVRQPGSALPAWSAPAAAGGADVWDAAMPLVAEG